MSKWARVRFKANDRDYRPIKTGFPGPWWCSGYREAYSIIVAYVPLPDYEKVIVEYWPEAAHIELLSEESEITFTDRFRRPAWWKGGGRHERMGHE